MKITVEINIMAKRVAFVDPSYQTHYPIAANVKPLTHLI